jgi:hypothetical protein
MAEYIAQRKDKIRKDIAKEKEVKPGLAVVPDVGDDDVRRHRRPSSSVTPAAAPPAPYNRTYARPVFASLPITRG